MRAAIAWAPPLLVLMLHAPLLEAQPTASRILILQSLSRGNLVLDLFTSHLRVDIDRLAGTPTNVVQIVVAPTGQANAAEQELLNYIGSLYPDGREPDLIMTIGAPAAIFARKYRSRLFPAKPLLLAAVDQRFVRGAPLAPNETAVASANDHSLIVDDILRLLPLTKQVLMVVGTGTIGKYWRQELERQFSRFHERLTFIWDDNLTLPEILRRAATLPPNSAVYYFTFGTDAVGAAYADDRVLAALHDSANAPLFGAHSAMLGYGIVGGRMMAIEDLAHKTADVAVRILKGSRPESIRPAPQPPGLPHFDWRELKRWNIDESRLPAGSVVDYRAASPWQEYRLAILSTLGALILQSILIFTLVRERRARQRAELDSRRSLALAADVSRRQMMSALTNSMAHELGQPLSSIMYDTSALQRMVGSDRSESGTIGEIVEDIHSQSLRAQQIIDRHRQMLRSRQVQKRPVDLHSLIKETLALLGHDIREQHIETSLDLSAERCVIDADPVLLQQVIMNLAINAMDAMSTTEDARHLTIRTEVTAADVEVSIRDAGTGMRPDVLGSLFTPFVTTKGHGLGIGLTIARTIVEAHGGTIEASNNPDGGATFVFTLRKTQPADVVSSMHAVQA